MRNTAFARFPKVGCGSIISRCLLALAYALALVVGLQPVLGMNRESTREVGTSNQLFARPEHPGKDAVTHLAVTDIAVQGAPAPLPVQALSIQAPLADLPSVALTQDLSGLRHYIQQGWKSLRRSMTECSSLADPKVSEKPLLYFPQEMELPAEIKALEAECRITVARLPKRIAHFGELDPKALSAHGLLYLPNPYVVPGGMFNEMYGWDSYFIIRGLLRDGETALAQGMVENFFFE